MPKLIIASDLDGTLILHSRTDTTNPEDTVSSDLFPVLDALSEKNILFCAATGRNYSSAAEHFGEYADKIAFLCENGAVLYYKGILLDTIDIPRDLSQNIVFSIASIPDCFARINTTENVYYYVENEAQADLMRSWEYPDAVTALTFDAVKGDITQISAISLGPAEPSANVLIPLWRDKVGVMIAGEHWVDFTNAGKGKGLQLLCRHLNIPLSAAVAIGDNYNDEDMLKAAGTAYIMDTAPKDLLDRISKHTSDALQTIKQYCC